VGYKQSRYDAWVLSACILSEENKLTESLPDLLAGRVKRAWYVKTLATRKRVCGRRSALVIALWGEERELISKRPRKKETQYWLQKKTDIQMFVPSMLSFASTCV
jgi:hypothetical protein